MSPPTYPNMLWINAVKSRYYRAFLCQDLFGEWTLVRVWGGLGSRLGGMRSSGVPSYDAGLAEIGAIAKRRRQHGYEPVVG